MTENFISRIKESIIQSSRDNTGGWEFPFSVSKNHGRGTGCEETRKNVPRKGCVKNKIRYSKSYILLYLIFLFTDFISDQLLNLPSVFHGIQSSIQYRLRAQSAEPIKHNAVRAFVSLKQKSLSDRLRRR